VVGRGEPHADRRSLGGPLDWMKVGRRDPQQRQIMPLVGRHKLSRQLPAVRQHAHDVAVQFASLRRDKAFAVHDRAECDLDVFHHHLHGGLAAVGHHFRERVANRGVVALQRIGGTQPGHPFEPTSHLAVGLRVAFDQFPFLSASGWNGGGNQSVAG